MKKPLFSTAFAVLACLGLASSMALAQAPARKSFGKAKPFKAEELPAGELKSQLQTLPPQARGKAMQWLHTFDFSDFDAEEHLRADNDGGIFIVCPDEHGNCAGKSHKAEKPEPVEDNSVSDESIIGEPGQASDPPVESAAVPVSSPPAHHSKPGAANVIYLDFNGATVSGKAWSKTYNGTTWRSWDCHAWSSDSDRTTFSDEEQANIKRMWERVAEDYAPFDINVTTDAAYDPDNYTGDKNKVGWLLITPTTDKNGARCPHYSYGGIAYVGVFGNSNYFSRYQPAWVTAYTASFANMMEAASHEMGHNMGLSHDGTSVGALSYYNGHAATSTAPSWGPLMGTGYNRNVSQWCKGEYFDANLFQDDLSIISARVPYRADDHGDSFATATSWPSETGSVTQKGVVETTGNADYFTFSTGGGTITFNASPYKCDTQTWGSNLDILLELYDSTQTLVASSNPAADVTASISQTVPPGDYHLVLKPVAAGSPLTSPRSGYTNYGSLGQYTITGSFAPYQPLGLTSITPASGDSGTTVTVDITGSLLAADTTLKLKQPGRADISGTSVQMIGNTLRCQFNLTGAAGGLWSLHASNADLQTATLANAFTVNGVSTPNLSPIVTTAASTSSIETETVGATTYQIIRGTNTNLSVAASDDVAESYLAYNWTSTGGPAPVVFSTNGNNAAKNTTVTFSQPGDYLLTATVMDTGGLSATSSVNVRVLETQTILVTPETILLTVDETQQFEATAINQFGTPLASQPSPINWSASGGGTITSGGLFTANTIGGPYTITASGGSLSGTAEVNISPYPASVEIQNLTQFHDGTQKTVTFTTTPSGLPCSVTYDGQSTAPSAAGSYAVEVTVTDPNYQGFAIGTLVIGYKVSYQGNGNTSGTVPADQIKPQDVALTLATNSGNLNKTDYGFTGWNTAAVGNGTAYPAGGTYTGNAALTLYAVWSPGSNGTWTKTAAGPFNWSDTANWNAGAGPIAFGTDFTASFTADITAAQTVNLDTIRTIGNITFTDSTTSSHNLTISGANILTLDVTSGAPVIDVTQSDRTLTISSQIAGNEGLQKNGAGTLALSNASNNYTGATTITGGALVVNANALPGGIATTGGTSALTFNGGVLGLSDGNFTRSLGTAGTVTAANFTGSGGWAAYGANRTVNLGGASAQIAWATAGTGFNGQTLILSNATATHSVNFQNGIDLGTAARTVQVDNGTAAVDAELSGVITGGTGGTLTKTGAGILNLSGANSYTGATIITAGTLSTNTFANAGSNSGIGAFATVGAGGLLLQGGSLTYTGATVTTDRGFTFGAASSTTTGTITVNTAGAILTMGNATINSTGALTVAGGTGSSLALGTVTQNVNFVTAASSKPLSISAITLGASGLQLNPGTSTSLTVGNITGTNLNYTIGGASGAVTGNIALGSGNLTKAGSGTWTLTGSSSYTGTTSVNNGVLEFNSIANVGVGNNSALGAPTTTANGTISMGAGTWRYIGTGHSSNRVINLNGTAPTLDMSGTGTLTFTSALTATNASVKTLTLTGSTAGIGELAGAIINNNSTNTTAVTKTGTGTWRLTGTNSYTGTTTISGAGKLFINGNQSAAIGAVSVAATSTLGGTGTIGGDITIAATGKLEFNLSTAAGSHDKLELAAGKTLTFSGASTLTITSSGSPSPGDYTLVTAPGGFGASVPPATVNLPIGWTANAPRFVGTDLKIHITSTGVDTYAAWSGGAPFDADANGDGVDNGLAWLLGAADKNESALNKLPVASRNGAYLRLTFRCLKSANRGGAQLKVQSSANLGISDPWTSHEAAVPDVDGTSNGVVFDTTDDGNFINVIADIPATGTQLFGRLNAASGP